MCCKFFTVIGLAAITASIAVAQTHKDKTPPQKPTPGHSAPSMGQDSKMPEMQLPPGWTKEDMEACQAASTPGPEQAKLMESVGMWTGTCKMWMAPDTEPVTSDVTSKITSIMDGRYVKCESTGEMMGMPFHGEGVYGFDNVSKTYQATWIDNMGTAIMMGTGEPNSAENTMTWTFHYTCPITHKQTTMREVDRKTGPNSSTLEMYGIDPHNGKEYKMMELSLTRKPGEMETAEGHER